MNWATRTKKKVHAETLLVKEIQEMSSWCRNAAIIARTVGCSYGHVRRIQRLKRSSAHIFLEPETIKMMR